MRKTPTVAAILLFAVCASGQGKWTLVNPLSQGSTLNSIVWTGALWVAVGELGAIVTSPDGLNWTVRRAGNDHGINAVAWTGRRLVAVGVGITATSEDGITWISEGNGSGMNAIAWTGKQLVAVGLNGTIATSPDGGAWTQRSAGTNATFNSVAWTGSLAVAVDANGTISTSRDGADWIEVHTQSGVELNSIGWTGTRLVTVGGKLSEGKISSPANLVTLISENGSDWTARIHDLPAGKAVVWTGSRFVLSCLDGSLWVSADGQDWSKVADGGGLSYGRPGNFIRAFAVSNFGLVGVGSEGLTLFSTQGLAWERAGSGNTQDLTGVVWTGRQAVAVGHSGTIMTSSDGIAWTERKSGVTDGLFAIAASESLLVATGWGGTILSSRDGVTWSGSRPFTGYPLDAIASGGGLFVAVGSLGTVISSSNGMDWRPGTGTSDYQLKSITWAGDKFVAAGGGGKFGWDGAVLTSPDGMHWTERKIAADDGVSVIWTGDQCYLLDEGGSIFKSMDGISWTQVHQGTRHASALVWAGDRVVSVGYEALVSMDGAHWEVQPTGVSLFLRSATWTGSRFIAVGSGGTIAVSPKTVGTRIQVVPGRRQRLQAMPGPRLILPGRSGFYLMNGAHLP